MSWELPTPTHLWLAIELYLSLAYDAAPPLAVRGRLETLRPAAPGEIFQLPIFERTPPEGPTKYSLRLGNRFYPHMKLVIERSPDGMHALFRADTHDRHVQPAAGSAEAAAFADLARKNQELAQKIETAWDQNHLPTFKQYLREDLARRKAAAGG